ncbi:MAG: flagellar export chaperone FliS [Armatimonadota bacterium]|nr:flagellar export chaperone FliS [bacterium]MDW8103617.1 flagellar export chaperone FliS [Armatimonadota bacterium]MDW8291207.1 flagellar export chaperone FliS [Armatimonadota bacterium]
MAWTSPTEVYQQTQVGTASPTRLVVMLYDGAIRFLKQGQAAIQQRDHERQNHCLVRAQRIIAALMGALNLEEGGEIARNLLALYQFMHEQLVLANLEDDADRVQRVCQMLESLREAWAQVDVMMREASTPAAGSTKEVSHAA